MVVGVVAQDASTKYIRLVVFCLERRSMIGSLQLGLFYLALPDFTGFHRYLHAITEFAHISLFFTRFSSS